MKERLGKDGSIGLYLAYLFVCLFCYAGLLGFECLNIFMSLAEGNTLINLTLQVLEYEFSEHNLASIVFFPGDSVSGSDSQV